MSHFTSVGLAAILCGTALSVDASAATISPGLRRQLDALAAQPAPSGSAGRVLTIVTFHTATGLNGVAGLDTAGSGLLASLGIVPAARLEPLGIIAAELTAAQIQALADDPRVRSLYDNYRLQYHLSQARVLCGVDRLRNDPEFIALNGGRAVDGAGSFAGTRTQPNRPQFSVVVIDSGLDTTGALGANADLAYNNSSLGILNTAMPPNGYLVAPTIPATKVIQNVQVAGTGVGTITYLENQLQNDSVGHGSHCAGIVGGLGTFSQTVAAVTGYNGNPNDPIVGSAQDFSGVATGARIIGCGSGAALFVLDALGGFNYAINFQTFYNVRITSNSYGSEGAYDEADPLNVAIKAAYDRNITNVFAAGNSGPGVDTISNSSKSPYVICVAAGTKEGGLVGFSSRGKPASERGNAVDAFNLPAITAPGTGREFEFNAPPAIDVANPAAAPGKRFTSDMISTRSKIPGAAAGLNDQELPAPYQAVYTQISGTSMACPFVAGVVALLLDVDFSLTPDSAHPAANGRKGIKEILQATATRMPDYQDWEVGAGYLNAYAAVDLAFRQTRGYLPFNRVDAPYASGYPPFVAQISSLPLPAPETRPVQGNGTVYPPATIDGSNGRENLALAYAPASVAATDYASALAKAAGGDNAYAFTVDAAPNGQPIDVQPSQRTTLLDVRMQFGNDSVAGLAGGNTLGFLLYAPDGTTYSSGVALPVLDSPTRQVVVRSPKPGLWVLELRGLRGLAAAPISSPTGLGLPDTTTGQIYRRNSRLLNPPSDLAGLIDTTDIEAALLNRYLDVLPTGNFEPGALVTRGAFAQVLADNLPVRQSLGAGPRFVDVSGPLARIAEAVASNGSTLRDWDYSPPGLMPVTGNLFQPDNLISRLEVAIALVRGLGLEREASTLNPAAVTVTVNGQTHPVSDVGTLSAAERGFVQFALDRGILLPGFTRNGEVRVFPGRAPTRAQLAGSLVQFRTAFRRGN